MWNFAENCGKLVRFVESGQIPGKLVRFLETWSDLWQTGQIVELVEVLKTGENAVPVHKSWPEEGGNGRQRRQNRLVGLISIRSLLP